MTSQNLPLGPQILPSGHLGAPKGPRVTKKWPQNHKSARSTCQMRGPALPNGHWTPKIMKNRRKSRRWSAKIAKNDHSFPLFLYRGKPKKDSIPSSFCRLFRSKSAGTVPKKRPAFPPCRGLREKRPAFRLVFEAFSVRTSEAQYRFLQALGALSG